MVGYCERGEKMSFSTNAGNVLTSLETTVLAFQEGVCYTGVALWHYVALYGTVWHCMALYGAPVHNRKPPVTFATTHIRCLDKTKSQRCHN